MSVSQCSLYFIIILKLRLDRYLALKYLRFMDLDPLPFWRKAERNIALYYYRIILLWSKNSRGKNCSYLKLKNRHSSISELFFSVHIEAIYDDCDDNFIEPDSKIYSVMRSQMNNTRILFLETPIKYRRLQNFAITFIDNSICIHRYLIIKLNYSVVKRTLRLIH